MSGLKIDGLSLRYGGFHALSDVNLAIESGTFVTLLGPSGSGKTTLLRCIAGLASPDAGRIEAGQRLFFDAGTATGLPTRERNLGMVFQASALWPHMTIAKNIAFPLRTRHWLTARISARVDELLALVGLPEMGSRYPSQLSGGQQQRVGLARAIACEPSLLLMDEPLSSLDARLREEMRSYIRKIQRELGITVVYVTHDREEALGLSDVTVILRGGRILAVGSPRALFLDPPDSFTATFLAGWSRVGSLDELRSGSGGDWVRRADHLASCARGEGWAVVLPMEMSTGPSTDGDGEQDCVQAEVLNVEFLGTSVRIELSLPGIERHVFVTRSGKDCDAALRLPTGARISMPLREFRVLPEPAVAPSQQGVPNARH